MYTSGTTGDPMGVMISNCSIVTLIAGVKHLVESVNEELTEKDVNLSYLPLAHIFDRVIEEFFISRGALMGFCRGDVKLLVDDIELKSSIFCAVPRVKFGNMKKGTEHEDASFICDRVVLSKVIKDFIVISSTQVNSGLGGNVRLILSSAAPLSDHVEEFLRGVACCHVPQGYGTFVSLPNELSVLGETLFSGYYKREDLTNEVFVDGWFLTGDVGEWQPNGSMKIIDRKKNIFKLSQGEYVAVENLENVFGLASVIDSIWIYGNSFESFLVAVVNPKKQALESWAAENGVHGGFNSICQNPKAKRVRSRGALKDWKRKRGKENGN
ncbi:hypothetical protein GOBAR_DD18355 [Gossypium barbadense]|nr:hypothetical protein GOBAR_DD18355 [Gossypium barbadense]